MKTVAIAFSCEMRKIFWRPKYWIMLVIYAAIGLGSSLIGSPGFSLRAFTEFTFTMTGPNTVFGALSVYRIFLLPLVIFMLCADVFTHEIESKSIKCVLVRPVSRFDAYLAKCLSLLCYISVALGVGLASVVIWQAAAAAAAGFTAASGAAIDGLRSRAAVRASLSNQAAVAAEALVSYALTLVPMAAFIAYSAFVSVLIKSPALVMFLCIASYLVFSFFGTFYGGVGTLLFTSYSGWYRMWLGERLPLRSVATAAGLMLSTCVAFFGLGYFIFDRKEI
jgi:ABC-2 type transport system permease protein